MLIDEPVVVVPRRHAGILLALAMVGVRRRDDYGRSVSDDVKQLLRDLQRCSGPLAIEVPPSSEPGSGRFRPAIVDGVNVSTAAQALGVSERAVRKACAEQRLNAVKQTDGTWLIELPDTKENL